jgi:hypothetical protein
MDQPSTVKATTQTTPEDRSRHLVSATSSSTDTTMIHDFRYFNFLGPPRELRDMIYHQFQMLHPSTPASVEADITHTTIQVIASRLITDLLLANKRIRFEYRECCAKRTGVFIRNDMEDITVTDWEEEKLSLLSAEKASYMHVVVEDARNSILDHDTYWELGPLVQCLALWSSQTPYLDTITVHVRLNRDALNSNDCESWPDLEETLEDFASLEKLAELKIIMMCDTPVQGTLSSHSHGSKTLLVHWQRGDSRGPTMITATTCPSHHDDGTSDGGTDDDDDDSDDGSEGDDSDGDLESDEEESNNALEMNLKETRMKAVRKMQTTRTRTPTRIPMKAVPAILTRQVLQRTTKLRPTSTSSVCRPRSRHDLRSARNARPGNSALPLRRHILQVPRHGSHQAAYAIAPGKPPVQLRVHGKTRRTIGTGHLGPLILLHLWWLGRRSRNATKSSSSRFTPAHSRRSMDGPSRLAEAEIGFVRKMAGVLGPADAEAGKHHRRPLHVPR